MRQEVELKFETVINVQVSGGRKDIYLSIVFVSPGEKMRVLINHRL